MDSGPAQRQTSRLPGFPASGDLEFQDQTARHDRDDKTLPNVRTQYDPSRGHRTRVDPFAAVWWQVEEQRRAEFGLSRFSSSRGLDRLERASPVSVGRMPGRSPFVTILDGNAANGWCRWEDEVMPPLRFRIRTIIIAIAALAVLMGAVRTLLTLPAFSAWAEIQESDLVIVISVPSRIEEINGDADYVYFDHFTHVPLMNIFVFVAIPTALLAVAVYHRFKRKRRGSALAPANMSDSLNHSVDQSNALWADTMAQLTVVFVSERSDRAGEASD